MVRQRRGAIYIMTLGTALIVGMLAAAALLAVRAQRRQTILAQEILQARLNAQTGLEMALFRIEEGSNWRTNLASDTWATPASAGYGTYSFTSVDPDDGDLVDGNFDPVVITATGTSGPATQKIAVRLKVRRPGLRCLEPVVHGEQNLVLDSSTATGDRYWSTNAKISAKNDSQVYVDAEAMSKIETKDTSVYHAGATTDGDWPREMPDTATVLDYYTINGTAIALDDLPLWDANHIVNPGIVDDMSGWTAHGSCWVVRGIQGASTPGCLRVLFRDSPSDGPCQDVTDVLQCGETYELRAQVCFDLKEIETRLTIQVTSSTSGVQTFSTPWMEVGTDYETVSGTVTPTWTGSLTEAKWIIETKDSTSTFFCDDASLVVAEAKPDYRIINRVVLSQNTNPFGAGTTNPAGIYVIDCDGKKLIIKDCRIFGTLVLIDQKEAESQITGAIHWEPAVRSEDPAVTNLPILLSNKQLNFNTTESTLDEGLVNANFNPPTIPYEGSGDSDKMDAFPAVFKGLIYTTKKMEVQSLFNLHGVLVCNEKVDFTDATVNTVYDPVYYWHNAPPGFDVAPVVDLVPGSFRRVVD